MNKEKLSQDERELLEAFNADEFTPDLSEERRAVLAQAAGETFKKDNPSALL